jgi:hypothetical protein
MVVVGFVLDHREGNLPVSWWQLGGIGAALGAIANFMLFSKTPCSTPTPHGVCQTDGSRRRKGRAVSR